MLTQAKLHPAGPAPVKAKKNPLIKIGPYVGLFATRDRINNLLLPSNESSENASIEGDVTTVVGRYRRDLGSSSTIGALYAGREGDGYHNRQIGADVFWRPTQSDALRAQYIRSDTQYPDEIVWPMENGASGSYPSMSNSAG